MRTSLAIFAVAQLLVWSTPASTVTPQTQESAPPPTATASTHQIKLTGEDKERVEKLDKQIQALREQGKFAEAIPLAEEVLAIHTRVRGKEWWEIADAKRLVETLKHVATLPASDQAELAEADRADAQIEQLHADGEYAAAKELVQRQLDIRERLLGKDHRDTAHTLNNLAMLLVYEDEYATAEQSTRDALDTLRKLLGDEHPGLGIPLNNLAAILCYRGDYAAAEPIYREVLAARRKILGEHEDVALSLNNLAELLVSRGDYVAAEPLHREALAMNRKLLGDEHPHLLASLNNLGALLHVKGDYVSAEPIYRKLLAKHRVLHGDEHPDVALSLNNLAQLMSAKGDYAAAEHLHRQALRIRRAVLGGANREVAQSLSNLAVVLHDQGEYIEAERAQHQALAIYRKLLGNVHEDVATNLENLGHLARAKTDYDAAEKLFHEALVINRKVLGNDHPYVANSLNNLGSLLTGKGDYAEAEPLFHEALAIWRNHLGDEHPKVVLVLRNLGELFNYWGKYNQAESMWWRAAASFEISRLRVGFSGLERIAFSAEQSPLAQLAACLARNDKPLAAWERLESTLARGLLDAVSARNARPLTAEERNREADLVARLSELDERISTLLKKGASDEALALGKELRKKRDALYAEFLRLEADLTDKYGVAAGEVYDLTRIQAHIPADAALLAWVDIKGRTFAFDPNGEHWACVVRHQGQPVWVKVPGSGEKGAWTDQDNDLPARTREAFSGRQLDIKTLKSKIVALYRQRLAPIESQLSGVRHLIVLPAGWMGGLPIETLADEYTISYAPSATIYAWLQEQRIARGTLGEAKAVGPLLALGDPEFSSPEQPSMAESLPEPPSHGVLITMVASASNAAGSGLRRGDVLLSYGDKKLASQEDLTAAIQQFAAAAPTRGQTKIPVSIWREGQELELAVAPGTMGVGISDQSAREAIRTRRQLETALASSRGSSFAALAGTRREVEAIAKLFGETDGARGVTLLLGQDASEQMLDQLAMSGELKKFRFLHLATHGVMDDQVAMRSALILSQDQRRDALKDVLAGKEVYDGKLTAEQIVRTWKLDADLVTLSACETALGKASGGEGYLGFAQALFVAGARSLLLSLWKVDDTATTLLMTRFYENLLGRYGKSRGEYTAGQAMPKAIALREAKTWLRQLSAERVDKLCQEKRLLRPRAVPRGVPGPMPPAQGSARPFEHPYYWSAFILVGDPN